MIFDLLEKNRYTHLDKQEEKLSPKYTIKTKPKKNKQLPKILILSGIFIIALAISIIKNQSSNNLVPLNESPEGQFERYLQEEKLIFIFFHSNTCESCIMMMTTVDQVYPAYENEVALVDINVYDPINAKFLQRVGINTIPTQVFVDSSGQETVTIGVMTADQLTQQLDFLVGIE
jgi:thiol:disulfide interchange protein